MKLIVNADDAGISPEVNEAILRGAARGVISAASVMVNMPLAVDIVTQLRVAAPTCSLGLHFCLTSGKPCLPPEEIPLLVDGNGMFRHSFLSLFRKLVPCIGKGAVQSRDIADQICREFMAQVRWFDANHVPLSFMDGHQHIQMLPVIFGLASREALQREIRLRIPNEPFGGLRRIRTRGKHWLPGGIVKKTILSLLSQLVSRGNVDEKGLSSEKTTPSYDIQYHGVLDTGAFLLDAWKAVLESVSAASQQQRDTRVLVNIHPATHPPVSPMDSATSDGVLANRPQTCCSPADRKFLSHPNRQGEWETVMGEEFRRLCDNHRVTIVPF